MSNRLRNHFVIRKSPPLSPSVNIRATNFDIGTVWENTQIFFFDLATVGIGQSVMPKNYNNNTRPLLTHCERNQRDIVAFSATQSNGERDYYSEFKNDRGTQKH